MATVNELFRRTKTLIDDNLNNIDMVDWFNQCQENLLDLLYMPTKVVITKDVTSGKFIVPSNCNGELYISSPAIYNSYEIYDNMLTFSGEETLNTITVIYNKTPATILNVSDQVPDLKPQFHSVYVFYAAMMAMEVDEEPEKYALYEKDYLRLRGQISKYYSKMRPKPSNWTVVR